LASRASRSASIVFRHPLDVFDQRDGAYLESLRDLNPGFDCAAVKEELRSLVVDAFGPGPAAVPAHYAPHGSKFRYRYRRTATPCATAGKPKQLVA
jgi:hypothetical protein